MIETINCATLWQIAPIIEMPITENGHFFILNNSIITETESKPPAKLNKKATPPLVIRANKAFITVIYTAPQMPEKKYAETVTIFDSPGFAPGGRKGISNKLSKKVTAMARAPITPKKAIFFVFILINCINRTDIQAWLIHTIDTFLIINLILYMNIS